MGKGEVVPRLHEAELIMRGLDPLAPPLPRAVDKALGRIGARALAQAAEAQAVGYVTAERIDAAELVVERAMLGRDRLLRLKAVMAKADPIEAEGFTDLVEDFQLIARSLIRRLPREF